MRTPCVLLTYLLFTGCYTITGNEYVIKGTDKRTLCVDSANVDLLLEIDPYTSDSGKLDLLIAGTSDIAGCSIEELVVHFSACDANGNITRRTPVVGVELSAPLSDAHYDPVPTDSVSFSSVPDSIVALFFPDSTQMENFYAEFWFGIDGSSGPDFALLDFKARINTNGQKITVHRVFELETKEFTHHEARFFHGKFFCYNRPASAILKT